MSCVRDLILSLSQKKPHEESYQGNLPRAKYKSHYFQMRKIMDFSFSVNAAQNIAKPQYNKSRVHFLFGNYIY